MAPLSSITLVLIFTLLLFAFSVPTRSEKIQLSRRNLASSEQESEDQPIPKPKTKKKSAALIEQEEEVQALTKPKTKKKSAALAEQEEEEAQALTKPKSKKKSAALIEQEEDDVKELSQPKTKKKSAALNEQEKEVQSIIKSTTKKKNPTLDSENQTKPIKPKKSNSTSAPTSSSTPKSKLNKTLTLKPTNSTKNSPKTLKSPPKSSANSPKTQLKSQNPTPKSAEKTKPVNPDPIWLDESDSDQDLISEFRDLPTRIHQTLIPDFKKISITSKAYIYKANKNIAQNVKPFVGNKYAPKIATAASCLFLILPLCLVTALFYTLNSYLSLQRLLIFVQAYLGIYFFTLAITALVTGFEPLRFFYATSPSSYAWTQALQTLGYLLYLLVQLIHLVVVFSAGENNVGVRALGLAQMIMGLAVGCHYYAAVFHRAVTGDPPRANWKVHGVYAGCFLVICLCARAERRKKAYDGGEDAKIS